MVRTAAGQLGPEGAGEARRCEHAADGGGSRQLAGGQQREQARVLLAQCLVHARNSPLLQLVGVGCHPQRAARNSCAEGKVEEGGGLALAHMCCERGCGRCVGIRGAGCSSCASLCCHVLILGRAWVGGVCVELLTLVLVVVVMLVVVACFWSCNGHAASCCAMRQASSPASC